MLNCRYQMSYLKPVFCVKHQDFFTVPSTFLSKEISANYLNNFNLNCLLSFPARNPACCSLPTRSECHSAWITVTDGSAVEKPTECDNCDRGAAFCLLFWYGRAAAYFCSPFDVTVQCCRLDWLNGVIARCFGMPSAQISEMFEGTPGRNFENTLTS